MRDSWFPHLSRYRLENHRQVDSNVNRRNPSNLWALIDGIPIPLPELVYFQEGPGIRNWQYRQKGIPFVNIRCLVNGRLELDRMNCLDPEEVERKYHHFLLDAGDILVSSSGTLGRIAVVYKEDLPCMLNTSVIRMRPKNDNSLDRRYLRYFLASSAFQSQIRSIASGSVQLNYGPTHLKQMNILVPPFSEQCLIASILGTLDDKIELNRRMNETLEAMAQALFKSWFVNFEPVRAKSEGRWRRGESLPGLPAEHYGLFPDRLVDSELGEIPEGWEVFNFDQLVIRHTESFSPAQNPSIEYELFSFPAYDAGQLPAVAPGSSIRSTKTKVLEGAILLSKLNPEIPRVWVPANATGMPQICSTEFLVLTPRPPVNRSLLFCLFTGEEFRTLLESLVTGTSRSHQRVPPKALMVSEVLAGSPSTFGRFGELIDGMVDRILSNRSESVELANLRDGLLPKLMSGELRVPEIGRAVESVA